MGMTIKHGAGIEGMAMAYGASAEAARKLKEEKERKNAEKKAKKRGNIGSVMSLAGTALSFVPGMQLPGAALARGGQAVSRSAGGAGDPWLATGAEAAGTMAHMYQRQKERELDDNRERELIKFRGDVSAQTSANRYAMIRDIESRFMADQFQQYLTEKSTLENQSMELQEKIKKELGPTQANTALTQEIRELEESKQRLNLKFADVIKASNGDDRQSVDFYPGTPDHVASAYRNIEEFQKSASRINFENHPEAAQYYSSVIEGEYTKIDNAAAERVGPTYMDTVAKEQKENLFKNYDWQSELGLWDRAVRIGDRNEFEYWLTTPNGYKLWTERSKAFVRGTIYGRM